MFRQKLISILLRIKYAFIILFDKDFYQKVGAYKKLDKYYKMIEILSRGKLFVNEIEIEKEIPYKLYKCDMTYLTPNAEECFDLRRQALITPVSYGVENE